MATWPERPQTLMYSNAKLDAMLIKRLRRSQTTRYCLLAGTSSIFQRMTSLVDGGCGGE